MGGGRCSWGLQFNWEEADTRRGISFHDSCIWRSMNWSIEKDVAIKLASKSYLFWGIKCFLPRTGVLLSNHHVISIGIYWIYLITCNWLECWWHWHELVVIWSFVVCYHFVHNNIRFQLLFCKEGTLIQVVKSRCGWNL